MTETILQLRKKLGLDQSVVWTLTSQASRFVTGAVTMVLIVRFLTLEAQGFAYTFWSILAISVFLELGFSHNILQFAAHEYSKLQFNDRRTLSGDDRAYSRLVSLGRLSFKYYAIASLAFAIAAAVGGLWFFSYRDSSDLSWRIPWLIACGASAFALLLNPCWALLQGCNQIAEIERFRFFNSLIGFVILSGGLVAGGKLYAVVAPSVFSFIASLAYLGWRWRDFFLMFREKPKDSQVSWSGEIWPLQWRVAISWISGYFIFSAITPVVFRISGADAAGKIGFTLQLLRTICGLASSWTSTKIPLYGILVARQEWERFDSVWRRATLFSVSMSALGCVAAIGAMSVLTHYFPMFSTRYSGTLVALLLGVSMVLQNLIAGYGYYLRAFKRDPYALLSICQAVLCFGMILALTSSMGVLGAALGYLIATLATAVPAWIIFQNKKVVYQADATRSLAHSKA